MFILDLLNNFMNPYLYRTIRKQFCEALNYHPIHGGWERPIVMNQFEFRENVKIEGESWWEWKKLDSEVPSIEEMIEKKPANRDAVVKRFGNKKMPLLLTFFPPLETTSSCSS